MGQGQGSITVRQKNEPLPAGPPFALTSADNGLSVDPVSGRIVLGNDSGGAQTAILLNDREIPLATFLIHFVDANGEVIISDTAISTQANTGEQATMRSLGNVGTPSLLLNPPGVGQATELENTLGRMSMIDGASNRMLSVSGLAGLYQMGDLDGIANFSNVTIDDGASNISLQAGNGATGAAFVLDGPAQSSAISMNGNPVLSLDATAGFYEIGDLGGIGNSAAFRINDATETFRIETANELALFIAPQVYSMGNVNSTLNGSFISVDDVNEDFTFRSDTRSRMMALQGFNALYRMGDIDGATNSTVLSIDDPAGLINFECGIARVSATFRIATAPGAAGATDTVLTRAAATGNITQRAGFTTAGAVIPITITVVNGIVTNVT